MTNPTSTAQSRTGLATPDGTVAGAPCHAEHTTGFTGTRLGRNTEFGAWQPCNEAAVLTADDLRALPYGSAVLTSGHIVWVKYAMHDGPEAAHEWGRCDKVSIGGFFRDSDWLADCRPVLLYTFSWPCDGSDGHAL